MTTRVLEQNEIAINGVKYRTVGGVTLSVASVWPEKQVTGDYNEDTDPNRSIHTWNDQRGGIGVDRWKGPEDDNRAWYSECHIRHQGHIVLPPLVTTSSAYAVGAGSTQSIVSLGNVIYVSHSAGGIYSYTDSSNTWSAILKNLGAATISSLNFWLAGVEYAAWTYTTGYTITSDGSSFTDSTKDAYYLVVWDGRLWGIDVTGQLWYTFTPGSGEVNAARLPLPKGATYPGGLFVGPDAAGESIIYALTSMGQLYAYDAANDQFILTSVSSPVANRVVGLAWQGEIYAGGNLALLRYSPQAGAVQRVGVGQTDGLPTTRTGRLLDMDADSNYIYIGTDPVNASGYRAPLLAWNGHGWSLLFITTQNAYNVRYLFVSRAYSDYRLWFLANTADTVSWMKLSDENLFPKQISTWTYNASAIHKYPWFDAGQNEVIKTLLEVRVTCQDVTANETVKVEIAYDYAEGASDASYTTLGTIAAAGNNTTTTYSINSGVGTDFQALRIKLTLSRGGTTTLSPDVSRVSVVFRKKLLAKYKIEAKLDLTGEVEGRSPAEQRAALVTAVERTTLTEFTIRSDTGGTRNYQGDIYFSGMEKTGMDEGGIVDVVCIEI